MESKQLGSQTLLAQLFLRSSMGCVGSGIALFQLSVDMSLIKIDQALAVNPASGKTWYERGCVLAEAGNYTEALVNFNQALMLQPNDPKVWVFQSVMLIYLERYSEALQSCDRALAINPKDAEALLFRGVALQRLGRYRMAYTSYENALGRGKKASRRGWQYLKNIWHSLAAC